LYKYSVKKRILKTRKLSYSRKHFIQNLLTRKCGLETSKVRLRIYKRESYAHIHSTNSNSNKVN